MLGGVIFAVIISIALPIACAVLSADAYKEEDDGDDETNPRPPLQ